MKITILLQYHFVLQMIACLKYNSVQNRHITSLSNKRQRWHAGTLLWFSVHFLTILYLPTGWWYRWWVWRVFITLSKVRSINIMCHIYALKLECVSPTVCFCVCFQWCSCSNSELWRCHHRGRSAAHSGERISNQTAWGETRSTKKN